MFSKIIAHPQYRRCVLPLHLSPIITTPTLSQLTAGVLNHNWSPVTKTSCIPIALWRCLHTLVWVKWLTFLRWCTPAFWLLWLWPHLGPASLIQDQWAYKRCLSSPADQAPGKTKWDLVFTTEHNTYRNIETNGMPMVLSVNIIANKRS